MTSKGLTTTPETTDSFTLALRICSPPTITPLTSMSDMRPSEPTVASVDEDPSVKPPVPIFTSEFTLSVPSINSTLPRPNDEGVPA